MSQAERDRLVVMRELAAGEWSQRQAGEQLGLSERQIRRCLRRYQAEGDAGVVHRHRGRASNRKISAAVHAEVLELLKSERYTDCGPTLVAEDVRERYGLTVSRETMRQWMRQAGCWSGSRPERPHRRRRARRERFGELVQMDSSPHAWLEERGPVGVLVTMIDDATGYKVSRLYSGDTVLANLEVLRSWLLGHGRPRALYTDFGGLFWAPGKWLGSHYGSPGETQIERALKALGIQLIRAHSPQAKGRVERSHGTDQDRLVKSLRWEGISDYAAANQYLETVYLPKVNAKFTVLPEDPEDAHRPVGDYDVAGILSVWHPRKVQRDYTIRFRNQSWQLHVPGGTRGLCGQEVIVQEHPDGSLAIQKGGQYLSFTLAPNQPGARAAAPEETDASVGLRPPSAPASSVHIKKYRPSPDHPWKRTLLNCRKPDISTLR